MPVTPIETMHMITGAVRKLEARGETDFKVMLSPGDYEDLLKIKRLPHSLRVIGFYGPYLDGRPLKVYGGHPLHMMLGGTSHLACTDKKYTINPFVNYAPYLPL